MTPTLETRRLILHPLELADVDQTQELFPHWEIVKFLAGPGDGARRYLTMEPAAKEFEGQFDWKYQPPE